MITTAQAVLRSMRGESHSYLLSSDDGNLYVTKFVWGETRRHAINEWIGSQLLSHLGLATPPTSIVEVTEDFVEEHGAKLSGVGCKPSELIGLHFGSRSPGDPATTGIYDYLPDSLLPGVDNLDDFVGALVFDLWCGKKTDRQAIFPRTKGGRRQFHALLVDNDWLFGGEAWSFAGTQVPVGYFAPVRYFRKVVYSNLVGMADLAPWFHMIEHLPESFFPHLAASVPREWLAGDEAALRALLRQLSMRRANLRADVFDYLCSNNDYFESWTARKGPQREELDLVARQQCLA